MLFYGNNPFFSVYYIFLATFILISSAITVFIILMVVKAVRNKKKNDQSPRLTVSALIVSKRIQVTSNSTANFGDLSGAHGYSHHTHTIYYVTFQVESGDRMELPMTGSEYAMIAEGDKGKLSFQGTRYLGFERSSAERK